MTVCVCVCVCVCVKGGCELVVVEQKVLHFSWFTGGGWVTGKRILGFLDPHFADFRSSFVQIYQIILSDKSSEVFWRWQKLCKGVISTGIVYEMISCLLLSQTPFSFALKNVAPIKTLLLLINQWFIFIELTSDFLFTLSLLAKHLWKFYRENEDRGGLVGRFEGIDFSCVFLPNINFLLSKHNRTL